MIDMDKKEQILHYHRIDGLSLREISCRVGLNRKTVTRYIREYEAQVSSDPEEGADMCLASRPKYPPSGSASKLVWRATLFSLPLSHTC